MAVRILEKPHPLGPPPWMDSFVGVSRRTGARIRLHIAQTSRGNPRSWSKYTEHSWKPKTYSKNVPPGTLGRGGVCFCWPRVMCWARSFTESWWPMMTPRIVETCWNMFEGWPVTSDSSGCSASAGPMLWTRWQMLCGDVVPDFFAFWKTSVATIRAVVLPDMEAIGAHRY